MNLVKLSIVFLALVEGMCCGKMIVKTNNPNGFAKLEEAAINILTNCYENRDKTIVVFGSFPGSFFDKLSSRRSFSLALLDDRKRPMNNADYSELGHRDTYQKVHIAVLLISDYTRYDDIMDSLISSRYYNTMAFILVIGWSPEKRYAGCSGDLDTLDLLFNLNNYNLLNGNVLCYHHEMGTVLYGFDPFASGAPKPWRSERHIDIPKTPSFYWFLRTYHENEDMCKNLNYEKIRNLGGLMIKMIHVCTKPYCSREASKYRSKSRRYYIAMSKVTSYIADFLVYMNATAVDVYQEIVVGRDDFDAYSFIVRSTILRMADRSFFAYPHGTMCAYLATQFRGNRSQLEKIILVIDWYSWIGIGIVCLVTLMFFKYFLRQALMDAILNVVRLSCGLGLTREPRDVAPRIYMACLLFFVVTMQGIFVSNLAALLTQDSPVRQVNSIQDLADLGYTIYTPSSFFVLFEDVLPKDRIVPYATNDDCLKYVLNDSSAACLQWDPTTKDFAPHYNLHLSDCVQLEHSSHIMPHYWPFEEIFNKFLGIVTSGGILMPLHFIVEEKRLLEADSEEVEPEPRSMTLNDLVFALVILGIGLACALVTFVIEIMSHRYHHRARRTRVLFLHLGKNGREKKGRTHLFARLKHWLA